MKRALWCFGLAMALAHEARAGELPGAVLALEAATPYAPGQSWSAAPIRFALLEDGQVFVGGTSRVTAGRLDKPAVKTIERDLEAVRKLGLAGAITFGAGEQRYRLRSTSGKPLDIVATGDPANASPALRPLAALLEHLLTFDDPSLRPYAPSTYSVTATEQASPGGCRPWTLPVAPSDVTTGVRSVPAAAVETWAAGIYPTSACAGARRYQVLLHPLLPGEVP